MNFVNVKVTETGLTVTYSDGNKLNHPDINLKFDETGAKFSYKIIAKDEQKAILYATKLGNALGNALEAQEIKVPKAVLNDLPDGYALYEHIKHSPPDESGSTKLIRRDTYLFGNGSKYRSPAEFEEHLLWLASDKTSSCKCRYCDKGWNLSLNAGSTPRKKNEVDPYPKKTIKSNVLQNEASNLTSMTSTFSLKIHKFEPPTTKESLIQEIKPKKFKKFISMYRREEIVWGNIEYILSSSQYESLSEEIGGLQIKYWPALVHQRLKESNDGGFEILYALKPLMLPDTKKLPYKCILPWLAYDASNSTQAIEKALYNYSKIHLLRNTKHGELASAYLKAIKRAKEVASIFTVSQQYKYTIDPPFLANIESASEKRLLQQMVTYLHYRKILLGTEILREDDYVRLTRASHNSSDKLPIFRINTIFLNALNKLQLSGEMFIRGPPKNGENVPTLIRMNKEKFEYILDLSEIAGRYYKLHPDITRSMSASIPVSFSDRKSLIDEALKRDIPETGPRKQMAKRSMALPPLPSSNIAVIVSPTISFLDESDTEMLAINLDS
ncbi:2782_t:CDS:2 [Gigaspora margarita]|uniref:2782_t:CDS:1 n=1 Tax=Gigaspora margarita TaxID=4874 RepID=A0ABN7W6M8_GIGMA|nr:2782_t:CDS:2 [Gigaspora margarita]